jgi:hypothetical protein
MDCLRDALQVRNENRGVLRWSLVHEDAINSERVLILAPERIGSNVI